MQHMRCIDFELRIPLALHLPSLQSNLHNRSNLEDRCFHFWILRDRNWRPEGGQWEPIKISSKFEMSAYVPKSPQTLEPRSERIAMDNLSRRRRPRSQRGSKGERNFSNHSTAHTDRSDQCTGPVWSVGQFKPRLTGLTGLAHRSDRCRLENPQTNIQTMNLEQTKSKSNQTWMKAS